MLFCSTMGSPSAIHSMRMKTKSKSYDDFHFHKPRWKPPGGMERGGWNTLSRLESSTNPSPPSDSSRQSSSEVMQRTLPHSRFRSSTLKPCLRRRFLTHGISQFSRRSFGNALLEAMASGPRYDVGHERYSMHVSRSAISVAQGC